MKQYQIDARLFKDLCLYHLADVRDEELEDRIYHGLQQKLARAVRREDYAQSLLDRDCLAEKNNGSVTEP